MPAAMAILNLSLGFILRDALFSFFGLFIIFFELPQYLAVFFNPFAELKYLPLVVLNAGKYGF